MRPLRPRAAPGLRQMNDEDDDGNGEGDAVFYDEGYAEGGARGSLTKSTSCWQPHLALRIHCVEDTSSRGWQLISAGKNATQGGQFGKW